MPMTKTQIVADLAEKAAITKKQAGIILAELYELATKAIKKGDKFAIPGLVTIKVRARKARIGPIPRPVPPSRSRPRRSSRPSPPRP